VSRPRVYHREVICHPRSYEILVGTTTVTRVHSAWRAEIWRGRFARAGRSIAVAAYIARVAAMPRRVARVAAPSVIPDGAEWDGLRLIARRHIGRREAA
jgi:hypothetical protein